eukprot:scaffold557_cov89-Skeletonema_dohrnii-CCMP3373.AAC.1
MPVDDNNSPDNNDDGSGRDAEHQNEEPSSSEIRTSAAPFATSASIALPSADNTSEDDQKPAAKEYASSGGMTTTTTQSATTTPPSPSPAPIQVTSKKRRENHEHEGRFSFREPFLEKLRLMLDNETNADSGSIQWLDGEDAFVILDQNKFEKDVIPKYFTPIIFQSFLRKLYRWGFKRITTTHAGRYKFASATFVRRPAPSTTLNGAAGTVDPIVPNNSALEMLLRQLPAANAQPNQLNTLALLAQLQQSLQPDVTQDNHLNVALVNALAQQALPQIQLRQQINQTQANSILQNLLAQQLVNQSMLQSVQSNVFSPAPNQNLMRSLAAASQAPLVPYLNQNQVLNPFAPTLRTGPSSEQALSLLLSNIQNAATAAGANQDPGSAVGNTENSSSTATDDPRRMLPQSQTDSSSAQPQSQRKRKHPHPPS